MCLESPIEILQASALAEVGPILDRVEAAARSGRIAAGFLTYEAAPAFDPAFQVRPSTDLPLAWFAVFEHPQILGSDALDAPNPPRLRWEPSISTDRYRQIVSTIHDHIARGDTYQVNFTLRLQADFEGDPWALFAALCRGQRSECCAFVDTGSWVLCSASPELFFELEGDHIYSRPMKGTAPRGKTADEDASQASWLQQSAKNRAENVMIVDMVRNDLGRIAAADSVRVAQLYQLERYPSVFQLTSTVEARTTASLREIFTALFPCASITGAPKVRATEIIAALEDRPRGIYTGAIGVIGPERRARFNVAIRTAQIHPGIGSAEYGTGGGIVWDSVADDEWHECRTKALVLQPPAPEFDLLETLRWEPEAGFLLLQRHLDRLTASADYFGFALDLAHLTEVLELEARALPPTAHRLRLQLSTDGIITLEATPITDERRPWRVAIASHPVDSENRFLYHKTTHRQVYEQRRRAFPDHDDVLLWNQEGEVTESTVANVVVRKGGRLLTPPVCSGLLAGTFRAELLERGEIREERVSIRELVEAEEIFLINSVRSWIDVELDAATEVSLKPDHPSQRKK